MPGIGMFSAAPTGRPNSPRHGSSTSRRRDNGLAPPVTRNRQLDRIVSIAMTYHDARPLHPAQTPMTERALSPKGAGWLLAAQVSSGTIGWLDRARADGIHATAGVAGTSLDAVHERRARSVDSLHFAPGAGAFGPPPARRCVRVRLETNATRDASRDVHVPNVTGIRRPASPAHIVATPSRGSAATPVGVEVDTVACVPPPMFELGRLFGARIVDARVRAAGGKRLSPDDKHKPEDTGRDAAAGQRRSNACILGALHDASHEAEAAALSSRTAFARGVAYAIGEYGARKDEPLSPRGIATLIVETIDGVAFGDDSRARSLVAVANETLARAACRRVNLALAADMLGQAYRSALDVSTRIARWIANERLAHAHSVLARNDIDRTLTFGGLDWADLQSGSDFARATGRDPLQLTPRNLTSLAQAAYAIVRNSTHDHAPDNAFVRSNGRFGVAADWVAVLRDVAVFHALAEQSGNPDARANGDASKATDVDAVRAALGVLIRSLDARQARLARLMRDIDAVAHGFQNIPMARRSLARQVLEQRLSSPLRFERAWIDRRVELYMSHPDGRTIQTWLPDLDSLYSDQWRVWREHASTNATRLIRSYAGFMRESDLLSRIDSLSQERVHIVVPDLQCVVSAMKRMPGPLRAHYQNEFAARSGTAIVVVDTGGLQEYVAVNASGLVKHLLAAGASRAEFVSSTSLGALVSLTQDWLFEPVICASADDLARTRSCEIALRAWTPSRQVASAAELLGQWIAQEIATIAAEEGYERTWRQAFSPALQSFLKSLVPLWDLIEAIQKGDVPEVGHAIVNNALMLASFSPAIGALARGTAAVSRATIATTVIRRAIAQARSSLSWRATWRAAASDPSLARLLTEYAVHGRQIVKTTAQAAVRAFDPGLEDAVRLGLRLGARLDRASAWMGRGLREAYGRAGVPAPPGDVTRSGLAGRRMETLVIEGQRWVVARDTRRPNGLYHYYLIDRETRLPYGRRLAIDDQGRLFECPKPPERIELNFVANRQRYEAAIPRDVRVDWMPALEAAPSGKPVVRVDQTFYAIDLGPASDTLTRISDNAVRPHRRPAINSGFDVIDVTGKRDQPVLTIERQSALTIAPGQAEHEACLARSLKRFEVGLDADLLARFSARGDIRPAAPPVDSPRMSTCTPWRTRTARELGPTRSRHRARRHADEADASGMLIDDGKRYLSIDGRYYFVVRDADGVRVCLDRARWKPCLPVRFDAATQRWRLDDSPGLHRTAERAREQRQAAKLVRAERKPRGLGDGAGGAPVDVDQTIIDRCEREFRRTPHGAAMIGQVRNMIARRDASLDLSAYALQTVPDFIAHVPWLKTVSLRPAEGSFLMIGSELSGIRELRLSSGRASTIGLSAAPALLASECWLDTLEITDSPFLQTLFVERFQVGTLTLRSAPAFKLLSVRRSALERIRVSDTPGLIKLDLGENLLEDFRIELLAPLPDQAAARDADPRGFPRLAHINLEGNRLVRIPASIVHLPALGRLDVSRNQIGSLSGLQHMRHLKAIGVSDNPLRDLPAELAALDRLEWINLERCEFRSIPPVLEQMNPRTAVRIVDGNPLSEAIAPSRLAQAEPSLQARRTAAVPAEAPAPVDPPGASDDCRTSVLRIFD